MGKSRQKTPISGITTSDSEKEFKKQQNRKNRRLNKVLLDKYQDDTKLKELKGEYGPKDGKQYFDPDEHPKIMRK